MDYMVIIIILYVDSTCSLNGSFGEEILTAAGAGD